MGHLLSGPAERGVAASRQHIGQPALQQRALERIVLTIKAVRHNSLKADAGRYGLLNEVHGDLRVGVESGIAPAVRQPHRRRVWHHMQGMIMPLGGPQRGDRDDAVIDFADRAEILPCHMAGGASILAIARVVDHQRTRDRRRMRRIL